MSTIEEFESAPAGATATGPDGRVAVKTPNKDWPWSLFDWAGERIAHGGNHYMVTQGYTLNSAPPATAREALDLAWNLAYPVKKGQTITRGTEYLRKRSDPTAPAIYTAAGLNLISKTDEATLRTLDPLPDPEPDWLDAPAVIARVDGWSSCADPQVFARRDYHDAPSEWRCNGVEAYPWQELRDVIPLYPKETDA